MGATLCWVTWVTMTSSLVSLPLSYLPLLHPQADARVISLKHRAGHVHLLHKELEQLPWFPQVHSKEPSFHGMTFNKRVPRSSKFEKQGILLSLVDVLKHTH